MCASTRGWYWGLVVSALLGATGCQVILGLEDTEIGEEAPPPEVNRVRVTAMGIVEPVSVRLVATDVDEVLSVTGDGEYVFEAVFEESVSYAVQFVASPEACQMDGDIGVLDGADIEVTLICPMLEDMVLSGATAEDLGFSPYQLGYQTAVSQLQDAMTLTATTLRPDFELEIGGQPATSGQPSHAVDLVPGTTSVPVLVRHPGSGAQLEYQLAIDRSIDIGQALYAKASNTDANDKFGEALAISADGMTLAVAAPSEDSLATGINGDQNDDSGGSAGAVYVFKKTTMGWMQEAYVKASNADSASSFGSSLALSASGDTLAVGAPGEDSSDLNSGAVYVFQRDGSDWSEQSLLKAGISDPEDLFGTQVSLSASGDTLAVGAPWEDGGASGIGGHQFLNNVTNSGAVYLFERSGNTWTQEEYIKASNPEEGDEFGENVALSSDGNTLAIGAPRESSSATGVDGIQTDNSSSSSGAVYIFHQANGGWSQQAYIKASNTDDGDAFGSSVSLSANGNVMAIGVPLEDSMSSGVNGDQADNSLNWSGAVYVFTRFGVSWSQQAYIKASNPGTSESYWGDAFGHSVVLSESGKTLAVGAPYEASGATGINGEQNDDSEDVSGAVYILRRFDEMWIQHAYIKASNTDYGDYFGESIALSGNADAMIVGASGESSAAWGLDGIQSDNSRFQAGAVYLFH